MRANLKITKKTKLRILYSAIALLILLGVLLKLLTYKPTGYNPSQSDETNEVSRYLTHYLAPGFYNGLQSQKPFDLEITQAGIKDIIAHSKWPRKTSGLIISAPAVILGPKKIMAMANININGVDLVVTVKVLPKLNSAGQMILKLDKVIVGAVNMTAVAKMVADQAYQNIQFSEKYALTAQILASILKNEPFEPVFEINNKKVEIQKIEITTGKITLKLIPFK